MKHLRSVFSIHGPLLSCIALILLATGGTVRAISMRHDTMWSLTTSANPYIAEGALYDAVGFIEFTSTAPGGFTYTSSGTLVESANPFQYKFLTAAHVVDGENAMGAQTPDGVIDATSFTLYFGDNTGPGGNSAFAKVVVPSFAVSVQSFWATGNGASLPAGTAQYDLAVMTFDFGDIISGTLPTPMGVSFANPLGQIGTMVGYGNWGNGQTFTDLEPDGIRRAGRNVIDSVGVAPDDTVSGFVIQTDFDSPAGAGSTLGTSMALTLESSTAVGDSGGPLLAGGMVVGVLDGGYSPAGNASEYGDRSIWASFLDPANQSFLLGAGLAVPEPTAALLLGIAGLGFLLRRTR